MVAFFHPHNLGGCKVARRSTNRRAARLRKRAFRDEDRGFIVNGDPLFIYTNTTYLQGHTVLVVSDEYAGHVDPSR